MASTGAACHGTGEPSGNVLFSLSLFACITILSPIPLNIFGSYFDCVRRKFGGCSDCCPFKCRSRNHGRRSAKSSSYVEVGHKRRVKYNFCSTKYTYNESPPLFKSYVLLWYSKPLQGRNESVRHWRGATQKTEEIVFVATTNSFLQIDFCYPTTCMNRKFKNTVHRWTKM